ncbi:MAG: DUF1800 domain-containing protein [Cyanobacteriota bacterium]|nr:DUF1800 domain-containing protein [Cyanobacteriota bacterium]
MKLRFRSWVALVAVSLILGLSLFFSNGVRSAPPDPQAVLHVVNRLSYGPRPGDLDRVREMGVDAYIDWQLHPENISLPQSLTKELRDLETRGLSPVEISQDYAPSQQPEPRNDEARRRQRERAGKPLTQARQARLLQALLSPRQLEEVMVNFWFDRFNVSVDKGKTRLWVGSYENDAIRPHALGKFRDLLGATARHPAMLFYLDNWRNSAPGSPGSRGRFRGLNENYARELMELHTLGVDGGYTQEDVVTLAHILTGWGLDEEGEHGRSGFYFDASRHDSSDKVLLGTAIPGGGVEQVERALDLLASHPSTAQHVSYKLAQYFVADEPPQSLTNKLADRFLETDGDIRAVLDTLFHAREFNDPKYFDRKFKTPYQFALSTLRAIDTQKPKLDRVLSHLKQLGMPLYGCRTPDGYPNTQDAWLSPDAVVRRINLAIAIARGRFEKDREEDVDPDRLADTLGNPFSDNTQETIAASPGHLRSALMLGSPEMMYR